MNYRLLPPDELGRLDPIRERYPHIPHKSSIVCCAVAEDERGEIVGVFPLQLVPHMEPLWVDEKYRMNGRRDLDPFELGRINNWAISASGGGMYYCFSSPVTSSMAEKFGMKRVRDVDGAYVGYAPPLNGG